MLSFINISKLKAHKIIVNSGTKINIDYHINEILDEEQQKEICQYFLNEA